ncbi:MAG: hypothetical protein AAFY35_11225 [Pseudomonadota bacterium]
MRRDTMREAPNYTTPALIMGGVNLFWILMVIWVAYGMLAVVALGFALERVIHWLSRRA